MTGESIESIRAPLEQLQNALSNLVELDRLNPDFGSRFICAYEWLELVLASMLSFLQINASGYESDEGSNYHEAMIKAFRHGGHGNPLSHLLGVNSPRSSAQIMNGDDLRDMVHSLRQIRNRFTRAQRTANQTSTETLNPFPSCSTSCFCSRTIGMMLAALVVCIHHSYHPPASQLLSVHETGCVARTCVRLLGDDCFCELHTKSLSKWLEARVKYDGDKLVAMLQENYFTSEITVRDASIATQSCETEPLFTNLESEASKSEADQDTAPVESPITSAKENNTEPAGSLQATEFQQLRDQVNVLKKSNLNLRRQRVMSDLRDSSLKQAVVRFKQIIKQSRDEANPDLYIAQELSEDVINLQEDLSTVKADNLRLRSRFEATARRLEDTQASAATYQATMSEQSARAKKLEEAIKVITKENLDLKMKTEDAVLVPKQTIQISERDRALDRDMSDDIDQAHTLIQSLREEIDSLHDAVGRKAKEAEVTVWQSIEHSLSGLHLVDFLRGLHESKKGKQEARNSGSSTQSLDEAFLPIVTGEGGSEGSATSPDTKAQDLHYLVGFSKLWQARNGCIVS